MGGGKAGCFYGGTNWSFLTTPKSKNLVGVVQNSSGVRSSVSSVSSVSPRGREFGEQMSFGVREFGSLGVLKPGARAFGSSGVREFGLVCARVANFVGVAA